MVTPIPITTISVSVMVIAVVMAVLVIAVVMFPRRHDNTARHDGHYSGQYYTHPFHRFLEKLSGVIKANMAHQQ